MKIALLSDIHGFLPEIAKDSVDLVLIAGDVCPDFKYISHQRRWLHLGFYHWLDNIPPSLFIGGNHDFALDSLGSDRPEYLDNSFIKALDYMIYGFQYTICPGWAFEKSDEKIQELLLTPPEKLDILMCHNPPFLAGDRLAANNRQAGHHIGSNSIRDYIIKHSPKLAIFGHIHEGYGYYKINDTVCINCAFCDERRNQRMQYPVIDMKDMSIELLPCKEWNE